MTKTQSSAELLRRLWERFAAQVRKTGGLSTSMRQVSTVYLGAGDPTVLSKWTNPGERANWRIPAGRIPAVGERLGGSPADIDELMLARLGELAADDPEHEALAVAMWAYDFHRRASTLPPDEAHVLSAFRAAAEKNQVGLQRSAEETLALERVFARLLQRSQRIEAEEQQALHANDLDAEGAARLAERRERVVAKLREAADARQAAEEAELAAKRKSSLRGGQTVKRAVQLLLKEMAKAARGAKAAG